MANENSTQPKIIFTDAYLDDPIQFQPDNRFIPETELRLLDSQSMAGRDSDGFIFINTNTQTAQQYPTRMLSTVYKREDFGRVIDRRFKQLITNEQ